MTAKHDEDYGRVSVTPAFPPDSLACVVTGSQESDPSDRGHQARMRMVSCDTFFRYYWPRLLRYLISQAGDSSLAEDVASETFMVAWDHWDTLLMYDRPDSWLYKVATRRLRRLEARAREREMLIDDALDMASEPAATDPEAQAVANSGVSIVAGELAQLPRRQREVLSLTVDGYSPAEIADILGIEANAVRVHLHHARTKIRFRLRSAEVMAA